MTHKSLPDVRTLAAQITGCVESGRFSELDGLISADATFWSNFDPTIHSWNQVRQILVATRERLRSMYFEQVRVAEIEGGWLQQHVLRMVHKDGSEKAMHAALIYKVNEKGLVSSLEEYFDPASAG